MRNNWRGRMETIVSNGNFWKILSGLLTALVMFLSGWVWNMEKRVTVLETDARWRQEAIQEIKRDVKDIKAALVKYP